MRIFKVESSTGKTTAVAGETKLKAHIGKLCKELKGAGSLTITLSVVEELELEHVAEPESGKKP